MIMSTFVPENYNHWIFEEIIIKKKQEFILEVTLYACTYVKSPKNFKTNTTIKFSGITLSTSFHNVIPENFICIN